MSATKREGMTLIFFTTLLGVGGTCIGATRMALKMRLDPPSLALASIGLLFVVFTILCLGLEDSD